MSVIKPRVRRPAAAGRAAGDVRELLVSAAAEVFAGAGYHASRVSDIVGRAGVAQGTFYLYFRSKEAVFLELLDRFFTRILAETLGANDPRDAATAEELAAQGRAMWRTLIVRCREESALVVAVLRDGPGLGPAVTGWVSGYYERLAGAVAAYMAAASQRGLTRQVDPRLAGWLLQGLVDRAMYYALVIDPGADAGWLADQLMTVEGGGLLLRWDDAWLTRSARQEGDTARGRPPSGVAGCSGHGG